MVIMVLGRYHIVEYLEGLGYLVFFSFCLCEWKPRAHHNPEVGVAEPSLQVTLARVSVALHCNMYSMSMRRSDLRRMRVCSVNTTSFWVRLVF